MNPLEQLYITIDQSSWDEADKELINKAFQEANDKLAEEKDEKTLHLSEVERQAFAFNKSSEKRLSFIGNHFKTKQLSIYPRAK